MNKTEEEYSIIYIYIYSTYFCLRGKVLRPCLLISLRRNRYLLLLLSINRLFDFSRSTAFSLFQLNCSHTHAKIES